MSRYTEMVVSIWTVWEEEWNLPPGYQAEHWEALQQLQGQLKTLDMWLAQHIDYESSDIYYVPGNEDFFASVFINSPDLAYKVDPDKLAELIHSEYAEVLSRLPYMTLLFQVVPDSLVEQF